MDFSLLSYYRAVIPWEGIFAECYCAIYAVIVL